MTGKWPKAFVEGSFEDSLRVFSGFLVVAGREAVRRSYKKPSSTVGQECFEHAPSR